MIHGDQDEIIPLQQSELFAARLTELDIPHELIVAQGKGHHWDPPKDELDLIRDWFDKHLLK